MQFGKSLKDQNMLSEFFLFNEYIENVDLSHNNIMKVGKSIKNLVRNRSSNIHTLIMDFNEIPIEEFIGMMKEIEMES